MDEQLMLKVLSKSSSIGFMVFHPEWTERMEVTSFKSRYANRKVYEILRQKENLVGLEVSQIFSGSSEDGLHEKIFMVFESGKSEICDIVMTAPDEERVWLNIEIMKSEEEVVILFQDHSTFKKAEIEFNIKEERYKKTEEYAHVGSWEIDIATQKVTWSDEVFRICGFLPQSFIPTFDIGISVIYPDDRAETRNEIYKAIDEKSHFRGEKRIIQPSGEIRWIVSEYEVIKDAHGVPLRLYGCIIDITERKKWEIQLLKSENLFRSLFDNADVGIALVNLDGVIFKVNSKFSQMIGYTQDELGTMSYEVLTYPDDLEKEQVYYNKLIAREIESYEMEKRYIGKSGNVFWAQLTISVVKDEFNNFAYVVGIVQDIDLKKNAERKLVENERKFKVIFNSSYQYAGLLSLDGCLIEVNDTALDFGGLKPEDVIGKPFWETYWWYGSEENKWKLKEAIEKCAQGEFIRYEVEVQGDDNTIATLDFSLNPVKDDSGKVVLIIPEGRDISEKKKSEKLLFERERLLKLFVTQAPIGIAMLDRNLNYIAASKRWSEDYSIPEELVGKNHYDVFPEISEDWKNIHRKCLNGNIERRSRERFQRKDGSIQWLRWEVRPWYEGNNQIGGLVVFTEDITEDIRKEESILILNKELEDLNKQKSKLFSVIAHDIKGPIANIIGLLQAVSFNKEELGKEELLDYIKYMETSASAVNELIEDLLIWARIQFHALAFEPSDVHLATLVEKQISVLKPSTDAKSISIQSFINPEINLWADENMLNTILRNLISNSIKFTKPKGSIMIDSKSKDGVTEISVTDNGVGIKEEDFDKLFSPKYNFTTYGTSGEKGTGLGLDLCRNFVEKHGGEISVKSTVGKGSSFTFTIPIKK